MTRDIIVRIALSVPLILLPVVVSCVGVYVVITLYITGESLVRSILFFAIIIILCVFTVRVGIDILRRR